MQVSSVILHLESNSRRFPTQLLALHMVMYHRTEFVVFGSPKDIKISLPHTRYLFQHQALWRVILESRQSQLLPKRLTINSKKSLMTRMGHKTK